MWQKASTDLLKRFCNNDQQVIIDTGVLIFQGRSIDQLQSWTMEYNPGTFVDLYSQLLPQFIADQFTDFRAWIPEQLQFFHSGTTREYFDFIDNSKQIVKFAVPLIEPTDSWVKFHTMLTITQKKLMIKLPYLDNQSTNGLGQILIQLSVFGHIEEERSLWNARLFPIHRGNPR